MQEGEVLRKVFANFYLFQTDVEMFLICLSSGESTDSVFL